MMRRRGTPNSPFGLKQWGPAAAADHQTTPRAIVFGMGKPFRGDARSGVNPVLLNELFWARLVRAEAESSVVDIPNVPEPAPVR